MSKHEEVASNPGTPSTVRYPSMPGSPADLKMRLESTPSRYTEHTQRSLQREQDNRSKVVRRRLSPRSQPAFVVPDTSSWGEPLVRPHITPPARPLTLREIKRLPSGSYRQVETEFLRTGSDVQKRLDRILSRCSTLQSELSPDPDPGPDPWHTPYPAGSDLVAITGDGLTPAAAAEAATRLHHAASQLVAETSAHLGSPPRSRSRSRLAFQPPPQQAQPQPHPHPQHIDILYSDPRGVHLGSLSYSGAAVVDPDAPPDDSYDTDSVTGGGVTVGAGSVSRAGSLARTGSMARSLARQESRAVSTAWTDGVTPAMTRQGSRVRSTAWGGESVVPPAMTRSDSLASSVAHRVPGGVPAPHVSRQHSMAASSAATRRYSPAAALDGESLDDTSLATSVAHGAREGVTAPAVSRQHSVAVDTALAASLSPVVAAAAGGSAAALSRSPSLATTSRSVHFSLLPLPKLLLEERLPVPAVGTEQHAGAMEGAGKLQGGWVEPSEEADSSGRRPQPIPLLTKASLSRFFGPGVITAAVREVFKAAETDPLLQGLSHRERLQAGIRELNAEFFGPLVAPVHATTGAALNTKLALTLHTTLGDLKLELFCEQAPRTCENFLALCASDYYNGTKFHRNIKGFMIQGGDPTGTGKGGRSIYSTPNGKFPDELHENLKHGKRGILSMANSGPNTNGSQFFLTYKAHPHLNGKYTVFGHVIDGLDTLDRMEKVPVDGADRPKQDIVLNKITIHANPMA